ncbi:MAG: hypothetical protein K8U03_20245 [Planctomycetia bacterium]|nr:hypothetical protein [Planctomycetia bacterium]
MDRSRKTNRESTEIALPRPSEPAGAPTTDLVEQKLGQLQAFVEQLRRTPAGSEMLAERVQAFGECKRAEGETANQFHAKLRRWLDRDIPHAKPSRYL